MRWKGRREIWTVSRVFHLFLLLEVSGSPMELALARFPPVHASDHHHRLHATVVVFVAVDVVFVVFVDFVFAVVCCLYFACGFYFVSLMEIVVVVTRLD